jgi:hypothetical protein
VNTNASASANANANNHDNPSARTAPTEASNTAGSTNGATATGAARWANRGPSGTPVGQSTPGAQTAQQGHGEPATPEEPEREQQFVIRAPNATSVVTPPTHPGAQPVLVALDSRCEPDAPPACPIAPDLASGYGWSVCVKPRASCDDTGVDPHETPAIDHAALHDVVQRLGSTHGAEVQSGHTIVVAAGDRANALLATTPPADSRANEVLLVEPDTAKDLALAATLPFTRVAWIDGPNPRDRRDKRDTVAQQLAERGISFAAITTKDRSDRARHEAVVRALAWLRAGDDSRVCDAATSRTARVTVHCNGIGDDVRASR